MCFMLEYMSIRPMRLGPCIPNYMATLVRVSPIMKLDILTWYQRHSNISHVFVYVQR